MEEQKFGPPGGPAHLDPALKDINEKNEERIKNIPNCGLIFPEIKEILPRFYSPFSPNPSEQKREASEEEKELFVRGFADLINSLGEKGVLSEGNELAVGLDGKDMDFFEYAINSNVRFIKSLNEKLSGDRLITKVDISPIGRVTRANTDFPSEGGTLILEYKYKTPDHPDFQG